MSYRPNKTVANFFFVILIILGAVIVKKPNTHKLSADGLEHQPPVYLGVGLIVIGIFGLILIWLSSGKKFK
jgi:hypothetical protein